MYLIPSFSEASVREHKVSSGVKIGENEGEGFGFGVFLVFERELRFGGLSNATGGLANATGGIANANCTWGLSAIVNIISLLKTLLTRYSTVAANKKASFSLLSPFSIYNNLHQ